MDATHRRPAVAGMFYPLAPAELRDTVDGMLADADEPDLPAPAALVAPHAGFVYSGPIAATAYNLLKRHQNQYTRVVLVGPAHRVYVKGIAVPEVSAFASPLGKIPLDHNALGRLNTALPWIVTSDAAHAPEHSLEVQLPFLQRTLGPHFQLIPLLIGDATVEEVRQTLELLWDEPQTLVLISTDLSHFLDYETAKVVDGRTAKAIEEARPMDIRAEDACGRRGLQGMLALVKDHDLRVHRLDIRSSGDTAGTHDRVVGYGAWAILRPSDGPS